MLGLDYDFPARPFVHHQQRDALLISRAPAGSLRPCDGSTVPPHQGERVLGRVHGLLLLSDRAALEWKKLRGHLGGEGGGRRAGCESCVKKQTSRRDLPHARYFDPCHIVGAATVSLRLTLLNALVARVAGGAEEEGWAVVWSGRSRQKRQHTCELWKEVGTGAFSMQLLALMFRGTCATVVACKTPSSPLHPQCKNTGEMGERPPCPRVQQHGFEYCHSHDGPCRQDHLNRVGCAHMDGMSDVCVFQVCFSSRQHGTRVTAVSICVCVDTYVCVYICMCVCVYV